MDQPTEVSKVRQEQVQSTRENIVKNLFKTDSQQQSNQGMPFRWAAAFAILCLGSIYLGHLLTIRGQEMLNTMNQKVQIIAPQAPVAPATIKVEPDGKAQQRTEHALGAVAASLDGTTENLNKLVDAVNNKFTKVQEQILALGTKIDSMPKGGAPVDLTDIRTALASLKTTMSDNKSVDAIVANIKDSFQRQDQAFRQLNSTVEELQKAVKDNTLKVNSTLGEKFPPPKK